MSMTIRSTIVRHSIVVFFVGMAASTRFAGTAKADTTIVVTGTLDVVRSALKASALTGPQGFSWRDLLSMRSNLSGVQSCNDDPIRCGAGATVILGDLFLETASYVTFGGQSYRTGCSSPDRPCFSLSLSGSVVLPPLAPTATVAAPFQLSGRLFGLPAGGVTLSGTGIATYYLRSPGTPGFPASWSIDRVVLRLSSPLPAPWTAVDVGTVGLEGHALSDPSSSIGTGFVVSASGANIWGTVDAFHFVVAEPNGNTVVARVDSLQNTNIYAKAGVMIRQSFDASSPHVLLNVKPDGGIELLSRAAQGGSTSFLAGAAAGFPVWLKLTVGDEIVASLSHDGQSWQHLGTVPVFPSLFGLPTSTNLMGLATTSHQNNMLTEARFSQVVESGEPPPNAQLPLGLTARDIGAVSQAGSATVAGSAVSVRTAGQDIWGTSDQFHYVYRFLQGNGEMTARVVSLQNTSPWAKAGIMIRESTALDDSAHVFVAVKPDGGIELLAREERGQETSLVAESFQAFPAWLRLTRNGLTYTASSSADGNTWTTVGQIQLSRQWDGNLGLAVTSQNTNASTVAVFDSISLTTSPVLPSPWGHFDVGNTGLPGSATFDSGRFTIKGAGADIWETHDAFHFMVTGVSGDQATLSARILSETNTDPWAKAGLMIRPYGSDDSPFVMIAMKPDGEIELLQRTTVGAPAVYLGGASPGLGSYLRLQRAGDSVSLSYSTDGAGWIDLISVPIDMPDLFSIGIAVTSRDVNRLNTAVFDSVVTF